MPNLTEFFPPLIAALESHFGQPDRSPEVRPPLERLITCYWTRVGSSKQAEGILRGLEEAGLLNLDALAGVEFIELQDSLRDFCLSLSAKVLAPFLRLIQSLANHPDLWDPDADPEAGPSTSALREELVAIPGIGQATADALLLNAFQRARYPLDRATYRILLRHGWIDSTAEYDEVVDLLVRQAQDAPNLLSNLSVWFEEVGRVDCRAAAPRCDRCPLRAFLPDDGPIGDEP